MAGVVRVFWYGRCVHYPFPVFSEACTWFPRACRQACCNPDFLQLRIVLQGKKPVGALRPVQFALVHVLNYLRIPGNSP